MGVEGRRIVVALLLEYELDEQGWTAPRQSLISQRRPVQKIPITDFGCEQIGDTVFAEQGCNRASRCRLVDQVELAMLTSSMLPQ